MTETLPTPTHPINQAGLDYWLSKRGGRSMPSREDLDPVEIPRLLPNILLLDVTHEPLDFCYRLIGTTIEHHLHRSLLGQRMSDIPHQQPGSVIWATLEGVVENKLPISSSIPYVGPHRHYSDSEDLIMPLSNDDVTVSMLFVTVAYTRK